MPLLADENFPKRIVEILRAEGKQTMARRISIVASDGLQILAALGS